MVDADVLLVAHRRAEYLAQSLPRLLDSLPRGARAWVWQNENHPATSKVIAQHRSHPRFFRFHQTARNSYLVAPTNWLWSEAEGQLLGKVDDDCLVPDGWVQTLAAAHNQPRIGIVAAWHFQPEDLLPQTLDDRTAPIGDGRRIIRNCWVGGSGYLMKRDCMIETGLLSKDRSFTRFCLDASAKGWVIGWHYPLVLQDHMDDPRSPNTGILSNEDLLAQMPLSARKLREPTVDGWEAQLRASAHRVQTASLRPKDHLGWRFQLRRLKSRTSSLRS